MALIDGFCSWNMPSGPGNVTPSKSESPKDLCSLNYFSDSSGMTQTGEGCTGFSHHPGKIGEIGPKKHLDDFKDLDSPWEPTPEGEFLQRATWFGFDSVVNTKIDQRLSGRLQLTIRKGRCLPALCSI